LEGGEVLGHHLEGGEVGAGEAPGEGGMVLGKFILLIIFYIIDGQEEHQGEGEGMFQCALSSDTPVVNS